MDKVMVKVSKDYYIDLHPKEAIQYCEKKEKLLNGKIDALTQKGCEVKAHIVFVNEAIRELLNISPDKPQKERQMM
jgi:prefoldin subunit 5